MPTQTHPYETVIGLELHVQLGTKSKIFAPDSAAFGANPNEHTSIVTLAHPGTLPRLNRKALEYAIRLGLALGCEINLHSAFDRKNYFYADLPKGYQITQDKHPICIGGSLQLDADTRIRIHHIHLEEDAGKSIHDQDPTRSLIDLNRAGVPLLEIVTEPDLRSAAQVGQFMEKIRQLVRWLGISDGNMEEGSLRSDVNVSVRKSGEKAYGQRAEVKNINSMRFARKAVEFESERQIELLEKGDKVEQETRGFDPQQGITFSLREKEYAHDYRYFPDPDLPPVVLTQVQVQAIADQMPPLPAQLESRFLSAFGLPASDAELLTQERPVAMYTLELLEASGDRATALAKPIANLLIQKIKPWCEEHGLEVSENPVTTTQWLQFLELIAGGKVSASMANQRLFSALMENPEAHPEELAVRLNIVQQSDQNVLDELIAQVMADFPDKVAAFRNGKKGLLGFFMGEIMKRSKGKADPKQAADLLEVKLEAKA
ncbi:MAG: Asp-tRNA(Asn)/Glu-tRNA(Gln) amidotransferase subunit GatB [Lewinellaceae bacterium]|nr:Asp-tRNA(Asn)/Glu-tRNA(Gln) amidotransferase subunit GatB [Lewinellaceae bacterium]